MPVSNELLKDKLTLIRLKDLSNQINDISESILEIKGLSEILEQEIVDAMVSELNAAIQNSVNQIISQAADESSIYATSSELEVNTKIKNLAPIIAGISVILPAPPEYAASEVKTLGLVASIANDLTTTINNLNKAYSQWH